MKRVVLLLGCLMLMPASNYAGELYRWMDKSGKVHYGDVPASEAVQVERKKFAVKDGEDMPYESYLARQNFPVTLYVADNCVEPCQQARDFLDKRGIPFTEKTLLTQKDLDDFKKLSGSEQAPTLAVGKTYLKGFEPGQWNSELDIAGYPKTLPYRPPQKQVKPVTDKSAASKPTMDKPTMDKPAIDQPATDKPITDNPATDKPATDQPVTDQSATKK